MPEALILGGVGFAAGALLGAVAGLFLGEMAADVLQMAAPHAELISSWGPTIHQHLDQITHAGGFIGAPLGAIGGFLAVEVSAVRNGRETRREQHKDLSGDLS